MGDWVQARLPTLPTMPAYVYMRSYKHEAAILKFDLYPVPTKRPVIPAVWFSYMAGAGLIRWQMAIHPPSFTDATDGRNPNLHCCVGGGGAGMNATWQASYRTVPLAFNPSISLGLRPRMPLNTSSVC